MNLIKLWDLLTKKEPPPVAPPSGEEMWMFIDDLLADDWEIVEGEG